MYFYTSVHARGDSILMRGYKDGKRIKHRIHFKPYMFLPSKEKTKFTNIKGQYVARMDFDTMTSAREFLRKYQDVSNFSIYGMSRFEYVFIHEEFGGSVIPYDATKIRVLNIDIEVATDNGYPNIDEGDKEITAITMSYRGQKLAFGYGEFKPSTPDTRYIRCRDEIELIHKFLDAWKMIDPDAVTGWNIEFFDIPYLINRIKRVRDYEHAKMLSPWGVLREKKVFTHGREHTIYHPLGVAILDYMQLYQKFTYSEQESYRLDHIAFVELGERKLDYSEYETLNELYKNDHQKFMEYNVRDVELVDRLEAKMRLIELVYAISYDAGVNFEDTFGSVLLWDVIIYNYLMSKNIVIPHTLEEKNERSIEGAFVKDPQIGMHNYVVSFDLTSLYPHLIMQYNISPDTFMGRFPIPAVAKMLEGESPRDVLPEKYQNCAITGNGCLYRKDFKGFLAALMEQQFMQRDQYKKKMLAAKDAYQQTKDEALKSEISRYNNAQMAKKIQLNSAYGALGNRYFRYFHADVAESVTMSGQLVIQWIMRDVNRHMNSILGTEGVDYIIASDTDSIYVSMEGLVKKDCAGKSTEEIIEYLNQAGSNVFEPIMKESFAHLAEFTNAYANKMHMKREAIADKAIWKAKKMYIVNVYDNEGVRFKEPELKMMGIEAVRSSTPSACRENIKKAIKLIMTTDEETVQKFILDFRKEFKKLPFDEIAFPRKVKEISKYEKAEKGIPIHAKAALTYNALIKKYKLEKKYPLIYDGDKIKFAYLKNPNPTHVHVIGTLNILPKQFELDEYIDYDLQFEKGFLEPLRSILDAIGWSVERQDTIERFFV